MRLFNFGRYSSVPIHENHSPETDAQDIESEHLLPSANMNNTDESPPSDNVRIPVTNIEEEDASNGTNPVTLNHELPVPPPPYEEVQSIPTEYSMSMPGSDEPMFIHPPTYEEVQRQKALEAGEEPLPLSSQDSNGNGMQVVRISSLGGLDPQTAEIAEEQLLGTDLMFFVAFFAAFIFNWVGFVLLLCFCHTVAGRSGALAGFGLSLAKWAVIMKHSKGLGTGSNAWLLWLIMVLGLLICVRAILQYISAKRDWQQIPHNSRHRFFLLY